MSKVAPGGKVDRMLARNRKMEEEFVQASGVEGGRIYIQPEMRKIQRVVRKIAFGLYVNRYGRCKVPYLNDFKIMLLSHISQEEASRILVMAHTERFQPRRWTHIQRGIFSYMFVRNWVWGDYGRLVCLFKMHETLLAAVVCPDLKSKGRKQDSSGQQKLF